MRKGKDKNMLEITKMLTLSTAHISGDVAAALTVEPERNEMGLSVYLLKGYGWLIYVPDYETNNVPECLKKCLELAKTNECEWLRLDCDGELVDELEKFDW